MDIYLNDDGYSLNEIDIYLNDNDYSLNVMDIYLNDDDYSLRRCTYHHGQYFVDLPIKLVKCSWRHEQWH